jgi:hypothetical protein
VSGVDYKTHMYVTENVLKGPNSHSIGFLFRFYIFLIALSSIRSWYRRTPS